MMDCVAGLCVAVMEKGQLCSIDVLGMKIERKKILT